MFSDAADNIKAKSEEVITNGQKITPTRVLRMLSIVLIKTLQRNTIIGIRNQQDLLLK